eukprot:NODE_685_length_4747_cov_0.548623.p1 type:complete len:494 gc:universal NODE_685_length_4747_cov_0.548623:1531-50(-)
MYTNFFIQMIYGATDCQLLAILASKLNVPSQQPALMTQVNNNCCTGTVAGVTCTSGQITAIDWSSKSLNGFIDGNSVPRSLITLNLKLNNIQGVYPSNLPDSIKNLDLSHNQISGPVLSIPLSIVTLFLSQNKLNGTFPVISGPLVNTDCSDNLFTGQLPSIPPSVTNFAISRNLLTGGIPTLPNVNYLYISDNLLTGDVSVIRAGITEFWIQNNKLVGTLTLSRPTKFHAEINMISKVVVSDTSAITECDISNNPLLSSPSISNLGICTKNNLFAYTPPATTTAIKTTTKSTTLATSTKLITSKVSSTSFLSMTTRTTFVLSSNNAPTSLETQITTIQMESSSTTANDFFTTFIADTSLETTETGTFSISSLLTSNDMQSKLESVIESTHLQIATRIEIVPLKSITTLQQSSLKWITMPSVALNTTVLVNPLNIMKFGKPDNQMIALSWRYLVSVMVHLLVNGFFLGIVSLKMCSGMSRTYSTSNSNKTSFI